MKTDDTSVGSVLLYHRELAAEISAAAVRVRSCIDACRLGRASFVWAGPCQLQIRTDTVTITIVQANARLSAEALGLAPRDTTALKQRLRGHRAHIALSVADRPGSAVYLSARRKAELCRVVTGCLAEITAPDLMLSETGETFEAGPGQAEAAGTLIDAIAYTAPEPAPRPVCGAWERVSRGHAPHCPGEEHPIYERRLSTDQVNTGIGAGLFALLAAISMPAAIAALVYRVFQRGETRRLAQLVAIAGLFAALDLAAIWSLRDLVATLAS